MERVSREETLQELLSRLQLICTELGETAGTAAAEAHASLRHFRSANTLCGLWGGPVRHHCCPG